LSLVSAVMALNFSSFVKRKYLPFSKTIVVSMMVVGFSM
jgi:hypothetical protein